MPRYRFTKDYNHHFPSRAHVQYREGWVGTLKRAVLAGARKQGAVVDADDEG